MPPRLLPIVAFVLLAGCAEENPHHPMAAGATGHHGGRAAKPEPGTITPGDDAITEATEKPAKTSASSNN